MKQRNAARKTGRIKRAAQAAAPKRKVTPSLALPAECAIASASTLQASLQKRLADTGNVQLDASAIQRIDTAGLQVLAAFARDRRVAGLPIEWLDVPAILTDVAKLLDLTDILGLGTKVAA